MKKGCNHRHKGIVSSKYLPFKEQFFLLLASATYLCTSESNKETAVVYSTRF